MFKNLKITNISRYGEVGQEDHGKAPGTVMVMAIELDGHTLTALNGRPLVDPQRNPRAANREPIVTGCSTSSHCRARVVARMSTDRRTKY